MELECDLSQIKNEELLRKMWQHSEDTNRKKEIRSQLFKLRESRLRDLYQGDIMSDNTIAGFGKDPLTASHGDALADQSFQSLKSKEIRDSMSPTEMKFQSMALNNPTTTGWNVQSSKELSPDGRGFRTESVATTDGVENINGGTAEFKGRNEQRSSAHHQGDDKNFVKKAMESSNSHLQEKVVLGDENSGRTEVRSSSTTSTSSSQVFQSSSNVEYDDRAPIAQHPQHQPSYLMNHPHRHQQQEEQRIQEEHRLQEQQFRQQHQQHVNQQQERRTSEQLSTTRQNTEQNVHTQETHEQNKRYVDMDKASPEYQQHVQYLMQQPGEVISQNVEYPKPNVKMITTVKRLPDGTIVRNKRYETEELSPTTPAPRPTSTSTNQTNQRRDSQQQQTKNYQQDLTPSGRNPRRPTEDLVDNRETTHYAQDTHSDDVETKFSSVKKSSRKFSTESTSETIHESSHPETSRIKPTSDFSTHGFPSVKSSKPTQEFPSDRPQGSRPTQGFPSQPSSKPFDAVTPHYTDDVQNITERRIPTKDGELIIVSSEKKRNYKHQTNSERIVETEHNIRDDHQISEKPQDFSTHGFPSVQEPLSQPKNFTTEQRQMQPSGFPVDKIPPGTRIITTSTSPNDDAVVVSSQKSHTVKNSSKTERIIEHEVVRDDQGFPRKQPSVEHNNYTVTTPGDQYPGTDFPGSTRKSPSQDYSTHGFPSVRAPTTATPNEQGFPHTRDGYKPNGVPEQPRMTPTKTPARATSPNKFRVPNTTRETTERVIRKEKEVDSAHRAFAASLRSSSPLESHTTDSHGRHTPRSSVSSTKNFRRDMREGSHDSAPSETSRFSNTTVTRQTPPRTVGGKTTVTRVVTTKTSPDSNENINVTSPRATKSPSPGKTVTTTTTTKTITTKTPTSPTKEVPKSTEKSPLKQISSPQSPAPSSRTSTHSYKSSKPLMADDDDDYNDQPEKFKITEPATSSPLSPSRSRKPKQPSNDERRTVNRETTFEKIETLPQERKPSYDQPNIEWIVVDDVDTDKDDDDEDYEDVDFGVNINRTTKKLITHEKEVPIAPRRGPKPMADKPSIIQTSSQPSPKDRSPSKTSPQSKPQRPLTESKTPLQNKSQPKTPNIKTQPKLISKSPNKEVLPSFTPNQRKPEAKPIVEKTAEILKEKTTKYTNEKKMPLKETPKRRDISPENKPNRGTPSYRQPKETETSQKRFPERESPNRRSISPENRPKQHFMEEETILIVDTTQPLYPNKKTLQYPKETVEDDTMTINKSTQKRVFIDKEIQELEKEYATEPNYPKKEAPKYKDLQSPQNVPNEICQAPIPNQKKPKQHKPVDDLSFRKTLRTTEILTTKMIDDEEFPEEDIYNKGSQPKVQPKELTSDFENLSEPEEDETFTETSEIVIKSSQTRIVPEKHIQDFDEPKLVGNKTPQKSPKPGPKSPKQVLPDEDQTIPKTFSTILDDEEFPEEQSPNKKGSRPERRPKNEREIPGLSKENETFTATSEFFMKSSQKRVDKEIQDLDDNNTPKYVHSTKQPKGPKFPNKEVPETPKKDVSPSRTQKKPDQKLSSADQTLRKTIKTTEILKDTTTKPFEDKDSPRKDTPYKKDHKPEHIPKERYHMPDQFTESEEDETCTETSEILIKSSQKRMISEKQIRESNENNITEPHYADKKVPDSKKPQKGPRYPNNDNELPTYDQTFRKTLRTSDNLKETYTKTVEDDTPNKKGPKPKSISKPETDEDEILHDTSEYEVITSQKCVETEEDSNKRTPKPIKGPRESPNYLSEKDIPSPSSRPLKPYKNVPVNDQTLRKTLRTTDDDNTVEKTKPMHNRPAEIKPVDTDDEENITENEEFLIETCQKQIIQENKIKTLEDETLTEINNLSTSLNKPLNYPANNGPRDGSVSKEPIQKKPEQDMPQYTTTYEETIETIQNPYYPQTTTETIDHETFKPNNEKPVKPKTTTSYTMVDEENWLPKKTPKITSNINEKFIETESVRTETPDGAFISKTTESPESLSPTFKKKGAGRRDTFEDRCRQILGMETYGNTPGNYKNQPIHETTSDKEEFENTTVFQVKIEDCGDDDDDDDEHTSINSVKENIHKKTHITEQKRNELFNEEPKMFKPSEIKEVPKEPKGSPIKDEPKNKHSQPLGPKEMPLKDPKQTPSQPFGTRENPLEEPKKKQNQPFEPKRKSVTNDNDLRTITDTTVSPKLPRNLSPESRRKPTRDAETTYTITETTVYKKSPQIKPLNDTDDISDQETYISSSHITDNLEQIEVVNTKNKISEMKINRPVSPTKKTSPLRSESPTKETKHSGSPRRKPSRESIEPKSIKSTPKKQPPKPNTDSTTTTSLKDRLRSSTRKTKSPTKQDQVDGSESSPEPSPTRISERRRSSNISVNTEIIIEHTELPSSEKNKKSPGPKKPQDSTVRDIIDSTVLPDKLPRKMLVAERKESAPVHRVTHKDKDSKMSRSTSENLIKVKKPESNNLSPKTTQKSTDHRRPNKCFATKTINLTPTDRLVNSEDMENVIIDIQHAKSSREPSPDKIVPTPVPAHLDTGKPRYPDEVQEPEDEQPRRKPQVKNIPIFEEENNSYVGFHITEVNMEKTRKTTMDSLDYDHEILNNPLIEAPPSLDYPSLEKPNDDECLLTVHEKVSKFQNIAEEVKKPKASSPFNREFDESTKVPVDDECLLTIDEKVDKFLKTAENVTKTITPAVRVEKIPYFEEDDEEFERNEQIFSSVKLAPTAPQKSPDLVRNISRNISRQSEAEPCEDIHHNVDDDYSHVTANEDFVECLVNNKKTTEECLMTHHHQTSAEKYIPYKRNDDRGDDDDDDDKELIPHTATHTTILEERRQKDILTRPSVFDNKNNKKPNAVNTTTTTTTTKTPFKITTTKSPVKDSEKLRPDIKSRTKPATTAEHKHPTEQHTKTSAYTSKHRQSPQHKHTDVDYELRAGSGSNNVETGVGIISKQTKVYNNNYTSTSTSNNRTTDNFKKSTQLVNTKPEKYIPVRLIPAKNLDENDLNTDEMIIDIETTTTNTSTSNINDSSSVVNGKINKEPYTKPITPHSNIKKQPTAQHSSTNSSPLNNSKEHVTTKLIERSTLKHNLDTTSKITETVESPEPIETVLEPTKRAPFTPKSTKTTTMDTVAARRSLFENNQRAVTPTKRTPTASPLPGRRPSYMDHTKSSLEHTRRDSLEINKTHYSRKPSQPEDDNASLDRYSLVKFKVPQNKFSNEVTTTTTTSVMDDINIEEIFDIDILESMLETVTSYEIRRRIRAQIRIIRKNQKNELITTEVITKTVKTSKPTREETDNIIRKTKPLNTRDRSLSPIGKTTKQFLTKESESHSITKKQNIHKEELELKSQPRQQSPTRPKSSPSSSPDRYDHGDLECVRDRSPETKNKPVRSSERSRSPQEKPVGARNVAHNRPHGRDDDELELIPHTATHTTLIEERRQKDILSRPSVFDNKKPNERSRSPQEKPVRLRNVVHNRSHSPEVKETVREDYGSRTNTKKQYYYNDDEQEEMDEIKHKTRKQSSESTTHYTTRKSYSPRKSPSPHTSPERRDSSPETKKPLKTTERSRSPPGKTGPQSRFSSQSPDSKTSSSLRKSSTSAYEQTMKSSSTKHQKRVPMLNTPIKTKPEKQNAAPLWADRRNLLKTPGSTSPKKPASTTTLQSRSGFTKTIKSTSSQRMTSTNKSSFVEDDCITSSYGIGPTDENGLPLFGIRALKKKKPSCEPCETTEEVTGYIVEEKCYSDSNTKPLVERKELIYSTNPEELEKIKDQVKESSTIKSLKDADIKEYRQTALISKANPKATPALRSSPEDDFLDSTTKYVRRGSVKEMSEKFIHRESSSSITEKSSYPKAGLILRTNSRKNSRDNETDGENYDSYKTTQHTKVLADSDDAEHEYEVEEIGSRHSGRFVTESESEGESIKTQREFKQVTSSTTSSTRSFLNTQGEEKMITNVSDCLERMRNADNVIEDGDTTEDQEARALLNKFLGASIIMKGVETSIAPPPASNRQSKILTTTTTNNQRGESNKSPKHEVKTTRITKTIKSGNSSSPVIQTTCDIEEIWDEEILKELLEQAKTYEERRRIRSRLRELMADREEKNNSQAGEKEVKPSPEIAKVEEEAEEDSSASEYEEIIEEVTDYSESEAESLGDKNTKNKEAVTAETKVTEEKEKLNESTKLSVEESPKKSDNTDSKKSDTFSSSTSSSEEETVKEDISKNEDRNKLKDVDAKAESKNDKIEEVKVESKQKSVDITDSSEKGESLIPLLQDKLPQTTMPQGGTSQQSTNSQKLKSVQSSNSKTTTGGIKPKTSSETRSMHAPYNKLPSAATKTSQNPIVTVQTAGRTDSSSVSNKTLNSSSGSNKSSSVVSSNTVVVGNNSPRQVDRLGVPQKEDSGTESGEDLRLIAAGLRDQLQIQSDSNIIEDVTCALRRLESSLKEGKDISVDLEKRKALLALVARLQAGLTSPEKLAEIAAAMSELDGNEGLYGESSSPEADAHRSNRSRFAKRRSRVNRHTVGVSREELADARRYMEDMIMMGNISQSTTPEVNNPNNTSPPQWYPIEKNASTGALLTPPSPSVLQRPKQFLPDENNIAKNNNTLVVSNGNKRRPQSGDFSVSFEPQVSNKQEEVTQMTSSSREINQSDKQAIPSDDTSKFARFSNKKNLMKRANTIDIAKTQKYSTEFDTDSDADEKGPYLGLKRTVQVSVKKRVGNVVPAFEPKTENDRKFLAFINKQSDKPGLGWTSSRSVSNWSNKFGSIKNTFEGGLVSKPPQVPHHAAYGKPQNSYKHFNQPVPNNSAAPFIATNQQIAQRLKQEAERQAEERRRKLEREHLEYERRERDQLERQRQQKERQERERLEREYFERQRREQDQIAAAQHAAIRREQEQLAKAQQQQQAANVNVPKPMPINEFKHAPQSVFRPIDNVDTPAKPIYKPIPQMPMQSNNWQSLTSAPRGINSNRFTPTSPNNYGNTRPDNSFITSPTPSSRSPIGLPWASKPTVDSSSFKSKANRFEERSKYDNISSGGPLLHRHNSLRSANGNAQQFEEFRKRPSLPNTCDPYSVNQMPQKPHQDPLAYLPPPQNISFSYSNLKPNRKNYQSYPCLPTAVISNNIEPNFERSREDSLTDPNSVPLVLSAHNPSYCPLPPQQQQQQHLNQPPVQRQFDIVSPLNSAPPSPGVMLQTDCTDDDIDSDNLLEYHAISRVMRKPQSQTAVTVGRRTGHASDDELYGKNSRAARNLLSTMKNIGNPIGDRMQKPPTLKRSEQVTSPTQCLSPDGRSYQAPVVEPLFPEVTNFEANRNPLYAGPQSRPAYQPKHEIPRQNMYKSLENLNRPQTTNQIGYMTQMQPLTPSAVALPAKPYVSATQNSYVVTYPTEETDDEDTSRQSRDKTKLPPTSLDLRRQRNISENSTGSSTTASISYNHNLPSPNTSWTANPIMSDDYNNHQKLADPQKQTTPRHQPQANVRGLNQCLAEQSYTYQPQSTMISQNQMMSPQLQKDSAQQQPLMQMPTDYMRTSSYEAQAQRQLPTMASHQHAGGQLQQPPIQKLGPISPYDIQPQRPLPTMAAQQLPIAPTQSPSSSQHMPTSSTYEIQQQKQQFTNQTQTQQKSYEIEPERQLPTMTATAQLPTAKSQQAPIPTSSYETQPQKQHHHTVPHPTKTSASGYEAQPQRQLQTMTSQQNQINQNKRVSTQKKQTSKSNYESQSQRQITTMTSQQKKQHQQLLQTQNPPIAQKPTDYQIKTIQQHPNNLISQSSTTQEKITNKKSLASMRKSISEDHANVREHIVINPQNSNISQEMISKLDQQRERVNNEIRRKSLGNALDQQMENQIRFKTQHTELYTSSAPLDTPDIVKSSLPKDENQPILKKFGPPQRHHYIPNAYQSPGTNVAQSTIHTKNMEVSSSKTTIKTSQQQMLSLARPTVVETPATPQPDDDYIPRNIVYNNVHAFTSMSRRHEDDTLFTQEQPQTRPNKLSKSDSWNQIIQLQNQNMPAPAPKFNQSPTNELRRTKSGHTLGLPKMFEAAMAKADISEKQKTVAAYFSGQKSPTQQELVMEQHTTKKSVINRTKTSEKVSASRKSLGSNLPISPGGLTRSATMPHIANLNLLDESNVEDAFEQLMLDQKQQKSSSSTTQKTETKEKDGAVVTTTTKVTTRTVSGSAPKPVSPFAKFKQLDTQNSQQSAKSPTTPTTPGGATTASPSSGNQPIFKFTDPALNARAATVKDQLLQWCQMKTQEYENIEITNFSTSWNNGLAFCALIHHFLPDAFDYSQLTPKHRRKNFELAFTVADEKAGIAPLLDVEDMVVMQRPDWKCVFVYVQSIYRRFRNCQ